MPASIFPARKIHTLSEALEIACCLLLCLPANGTSDVTVQKEKTGTSSQTDLLNFLIVTHLIIQCFSQNNFWNPQLISCPSPPVPRLENFSLNLFSFPSLGKDSLFGMLHKSSGDFHGLAQPFRTSLQYRSPVSRSSIVSTVITEHERNAWIHKMTLRTRLTFLVELHEENGVSSRG